MLIYYNRIQLGCISIAGIAEDKICIFLAALMVVSYFTTSQYNELGNYHSIFQQLYLQTQCDQLILLCLSEFHQIIWDKLSMPPYQFQFTHSMNKSGAIIESAEDKTKSVKLNQQE